MVESNFNMIELGPRSTGKSFVFKELSPYTTLVSGGQGTSAGLFNNLNTGEIGAVVKCDVVCFDEATDKIFQHFEDSNPISLMKDYMESGSFSRAGLGSEISGSASIVMNGNINQPVNKLMKDSHLFSPLPDQISHDTALLDRFHFYLPGWELTAFSESNFTANYGFSVDYFAEFLKSMRKDIYTDATQKYYDLGSNLKHRDTKAIKKTVSGFIKLIHPDGEYTKEDIKEYVEIAMEMRLRVKEQLKHIDGTEFLDTNFSYFDKETKKEQFISLPEKRLVLFSENHLPGQCCIVTGDSVNSVLLKIETIVKNSGSGILNITGISDKKVKKEIHSMYQNIKKNEKLIRELFQDHDLTLHINVLIGNQIYTEIEPAIYIAIYSALKNQTTKPNLVIMNNIAGDDDVTKLDNLKNKISMLYKRGCKTIVMPMSIFFENMHSLEDFCKSKGIDMSFCTYITKENLIQLTMME